MSDAISEISQEPHTSIRVLVAEDNPLNQKLVQCYFDEIGCALDLADDGVDAIRLFQLTRYDLVFLDCQMPNLDGFATARRIREFEQARAKRTPVPIVALTARAEEKDHRECLAAGMDEWITKPFTMNELREAVVRLTGRKLPAGDRKQKRKGGGVGSSPDTAVDTAMLDVLRALNTPEKPAIFTNLLQTYLASAENLLGKLGDAARSGDAKKMSAAAHALKSSSANIGALELSSILYSLESRAAQQPNASNAELCERAAEEFDRVRTILETELKKSA